MDILTLTGHIICHQVNCQGVMGAGLARQIRAKYPKVYAPYRAYCATGNALGTVLFVPVSDNNIIANIFGQDKYGRDRQHTDYAALQTAFRRVAEVARERNLPIAIPYRIGCGLGGGDWATVHKIIMTELDGLPVRICKL
jgi:O-acetyl-ADP-ribose deacetylase (regulator of RNase III)